MTAGPITRMDQIARYRMGLIVDGFPTDPAAGLDTDKDGYPDELLGNATETATGKGTGTAQGDLEYLWNRAFGEHKTSPVNKIIMEEYYYIYWDS